MKKTASQVLDSIRASKDALEFLPTGFERIDTDLDGGFLRKELVVLGGGTGLGKSIIAGQILFNLARKGFKTSYFSLEISNEMIMSRLIGSLANIKPVRIMTGQLLPYEMERVGRAQTEIVLYEKFLSFYDETYKLTQIETEIKTNEYEFVVIDFIQNIFMGTGDEYTRLSMIALQLQKLAKEANCCIMVLSQLSNAVSREGRKGPPEYKGSGSIATVCDLGFFIERKEGIDATQNPLVIYLKKNRRGPSGLVWEYTYKSPGGIIE